MELRTLAEAERYLDGFVNLERRRRFDYERLGTARIRALLESIGNPERDLPCIHVAGSKGKGSVSLMAEALLGATGRRVGAFTKPHLESWRERFRIDGVPVDVPSLLAVLNVLRPVTERLRRDPDLSPSFFDVTVALALGLFRRAGVDATVIEVGIGGRLDSTNVVDSRVSVVTAIQLEHTDKLGSTLERIAGEKVGILRPRTVVVHPPLPPSALPVLLARAAALDVDVEEVSVEAVEVLPSGIRFRLPDGRPVAASVLGRHQATNAALAVRAVERFVERPLLDRELLALAGVRLPARVEPIGDVIVDSAHTPDSVAALRDALRAARPGRPWVAVLSISSEKDPLAILKEIASDVRALVLTRADPDRSLDPADLVPLARAAGIGRVDVAPRPEDALARARARRRPGDLVVVTGSFYLAGALRGPVLADLSSSRAAGGRTRA